jgi:hypothetical protein
VPGPGGAALDAQELTACQARAVNARPFGKLRYMARTNNRRRSCPQCGSQRCVPIAYGLPGIDLQEQGQRDEVVLGGCLIWDGQAEWACLACGCEWREMGSRRG